MQLTDFIRRYASEVVQDRDLSDKKNMSKVTGQSSLIMISYIYHGDVGGLPLSMKFLV